MSAVESIMRNVSYIGFLRPAASEFDKARCQDYINCLKKILSQRSIYVIEGELTLPPQDILFTKLEQLAKQVNYDSQRFLSLCQEVAQIHIDGCKIPDLDARQAYIKQKAKALGKGK